MVRFSDRWWLQRLLQQMNAKAPRPTGKIGYSRRAEYTKSEWLSFLWARYTSEAPLTAMAQQYVQSSREFERLARTNWDALVVNALLERLSFTGVRSTVDGDTDGDEWVRGFLAANPVVPDGLMYSLALGRGWLMVGRSGDGSPYPFATAEDPRLIEAATDPVRPDVIRALVKVYFDADENTSVAALYLRGEAGLPDRLVTFTHPGKSTRYDSRWTVDPSRSSPLPVQGMGVPFVEIPNRLRLGEFEPHLDLIDRITNGISDRLWTAKYQAFLQRALIGDLPPEDDSGNPVDYDSIFSADPAAIWRMPAGSEVWESKQVDLGALINAVKEDLRELSAVTFTPLHMFTPDAMTGSAEGASLARDGLTFKGRDRITRFSPAMVRFAKLGMAYGGRDPQVELQAMWAPVEQYSLQQRGAAATAGQASGVPTESIWAELWQFPPETVARMRRERATQALYEPAGATSGPAPR